MDDENGTAGNAQPPPVRYVTANQVVAWNMARYRKMAGLTQAQLGKRIGWTNGAVSEAEKTWDSERTRKFDAPAMLAISSALGVPLIALLLPPEDDGTAARYEITLDGGTAMSMAALMAAVIPDGDSESAVIQAYRARLAGAAEAYLAPGLAEDVAGWLGTADEKELNAVRAARIRRRIAAGRELFDELDELAGRLEEGSR